MSSAKFNFTDLINPVEESLFFAEYWETAPLHISRKDPNSYSSILSGTDIDYIVSTACVLQNSSVELLGEAMGTPGSLDAASVYKAYQQGASIRIRGAHRYWKPIWMLCRRLEQMFSFPVQANLYCTPASSHALNRHYDEHEVFVLQIAGCKHWRLFEAGVTLPLQHAPLLPFENLAGKEGYRRSPRIAEVVKQLEGSGPTHEITMETGDLLYLPRGVIHEAETSDELSVHLTIGVHVLTWADLLMVALGQTSNQDVRFRKSLPVGFANETVSGDSLKEQFNQLLDALSQQADLTAALEEIAGSFFRSEQSISDGSIVNDGSAKEINGDTLMEHRPGLLCRLVLEGETAGLASGNNVIWMPRFFEQALRFIAQTTEFKVSEIPGGMSGKSKVTLVKRLVQEGFLRVAR
jgi:ribosomal protein L16 Arg81 hydroxylase